MPLLKKADPAILVTLFGTTTSAVPIRANVLRSMEPRLLLIRRLLAEEHPLKASGPTVRTDSGMEMDGSLEQLLNAYSPMVCRPKGNTAFVRNEQL